MIIVRIETQLEVAKGTAAPAESFPAMTVFTEERRPQEHSWRPAVRRVYAAQKKVARNPSPIEKNQ
jgi:hypothetical protein